jgi:branched-chain amino acid transport system ATP-binding protein
MLEIANLSVCYGALPVLHEVNLTVDQGELVALLGSNGAGKTTLLNVISRVAGDITSGNIIFEGSHIENLPPYRITGLGIAHVPEGRKLFPYLTVKENLLMGAYAGEAWRTKDVEIERVFGLFPILKERSHMPARSLSGGEQQMVAVARGLVSRPKLLMVDEPSLGLAPKVLAELYRVLATLHSEQGYSILLSEQNAHYALKIASRAYVLQDGRIVLEGRSTELLESELVRKAYLGK